ncbi:50S ribosomal protein L34, partial [Candidatus Falkowbacteria bacterium]|nr:50S ribosomal protein L34 [Candidatus Falkowbacteria bacterium]
TKRARTHGFLHRQAKHTKVIKQRRLKKRRQLSA